jgi:hypothetical protein
MFNVVVRNTDFHRYFSATCGQSIELLRGENRPPSPPPPTLTLLVFAALVKQRRRPFPYKIYNLYRSFTKSILTCLKTCRYQTLLELARYVKKIVVWNSFYRYFTHVRRLPCCKYQSRIS